MGEQEVRDTLRTLKKPTIVDALKENIPFPEGSVPKNGLPLWERLPLEAKLPMIDHPRDAFVLYRDKVGKKLWRQSPSNTFRLDDPYCLTVSYEYDPLHDANLAHIYQSSSRRRDLRRLGLLSKDDEAICSLHEFNNYRRYLYCIYRDSLKLEYEHMMEDQLDKIALNKAQACAERFMQAARQREEREELSREGRAKVEEEAAQKIERFKQRQIYFNERIEKIKAQKEESRKQRMAQSRAKMATVRYRNAVAAEIRRAKVAAIRQMWRLTEASRTKRQAEQQANLRAIKDKEISERWEDKRVTQEERMEREKKILEKADEERRLGVELHEKEMEAERLKMEVLFNKVKARQNKERNMARRNNEWKYLYINECRDESEILGRNISSAGAASGRTNYTLCVPRRKPPCGFEVSDYENEPTSHRYKLALCIRAMLHPEDEEDAPQPSDLWDIVRHGKTFENRDVEDDEDKAEEEEEEKEIDENTEIQVKTAIDALLTNVVQGCVHHEVMHTLKEVYHDALAKCRWIVERENLRQAAQYGNVCHHALKKNVQTGPLRFMGYNPCCATCCRIDRSKKKPFNPEKILKQIKAAERRVEHYKALLEEGFDSSDVEDETPCEEDDDTDGGRLCRNFEEFSRHLRHRIVILASQSVDERFKKFTAHRWKILKEVDLCDLMERLCNMMMLYDAKEFLPSAEFQWAADVLARDVMKEVHAQIRSERRAAAMMRREENNRKVKRPRRRRTSKTQKCVCEPQTPIAGYEEPEAVCPEDVPLLRLHSRSPHQPSVPSVYAEEI